MFYQNWKLACFALNHDAISRNRLPNPMGKRLGKVTTESAEICWNTYLHF